MWFKIVKEHFEKKHYNLEQVEVFVRAGYITVKEYEGITGYKYTLEK